MSSSHEAKEYSIFQIGMNLTGACLISGLIIAIVFFITEPISVKNAIELKNSTMKELVPQANEFKAIKGKKEWYEAKKDGNVIAYVVEGDSKGFSGEIKILVAVSKDAKIVDYSIIKHNETPGLGDGAGKEPFKKQFTGKKADVLEVVKDPSNTKNIQAMTGATITSRAVTKGIKEVLEKVEVFVGGK